MRVRRGRKGIELFMYYKRLGNLSRRLVVSFIMIVFVTVGCTPTVTPTAQLEDRIELFFDSTETQHPNAFADLDAAQVLDSPEADITLIVSGGTMLFNTLQPVHGARASVVGSEPVNHGSCEQSNDARSDRNIPDFTLGSYLCVLTNQGHFVEVRIDQVENQRKGATRVTMTVIRKPGD